MSVPGAVVRVKWEGLRGMGEGAPVEGWWVKVRSGILAAEVAECCL